MALIAKIIFKAHLKTTSAEQRATQVIQWQFHNNNTKKIMAFSCITYSCEMLCCLFLLLGWLDNLTHSSTITVPPTGFEQIISNTRCFVICLLSHKYCENLTLLHSEFMLVKQCSGRNTGRGSAITGIFWISIWERLLLIDWKQV